MTTVNRHTSCDNCWYPLNGSKVISDGKGYCCNGCVQGGPCICSYGHQLPVDKQGPADIASGAGFPSSPGLDFPYHGSFIRTAESILREVEVTRQVVKGQTGAVNDLMALLHKAARLLQVMAYQLEGRHSQYISPANYPELELQKDQECERVELVVENATGPGIAFAYTTALDQLSSVNQSRLLKVEGDRLYYQVWTRSKARLAREVMSMPGYRPLRIQATLGEITASLELEPQAAVDALDSPSVVAKGSLPSGRPGAGLDVSAQAGPTRPEPRDGTMEAGIDAFFNSRHYLTNDNDGEPGPIEMKSWRVEISLEGNQFSKNGKLGGLDDAQSAVKQLLAGYNNRLLNNLKPYDQVQPTPENIARTLYEQIEAAIASQPLRVKGLKVWASPTQYVWYSEPSRDAA